MPTKNKPRSCVVEKPHRDIQTDVTKIIPLSPVEHFNELNDTTKEDYKIYEKYLDNAFNNPRVRNIAVSGNFGVGKSSILRVYESEKSGNKKWLHVSMGNFRKTSTAIEKQQSQTMYDRMKHQKELEIDLLRQITAKCSQKDIPRSSFKLIPAQKSKRDKFLSVAVPVVLTVLAGLIFAFCSDAVTGKAQNILYIVIAIIVSLGLGLTAYCIYPKLRFNQLLLKTNHAEVSADCIRPDSYLEQHCFELVYVLESLVLKNKSTTVIFEDMDRLDIDMSIEIFSKLREINALVNNRLDGANKKLVFIYVVNDYLMSRMKMEKFFDYILSVVPIKCRRAACDCGVSVRLREILQKEFVNARDETVQNMINALGSNFNDFRMIYTVVNDYRIFCEIGKNHGSFDIANGYLEPSLFAFLIYKNLRPADYFEICRTGTLPENWLQNLPKDQKFLSDLSDAGFLTEDCLRYIGC